MTNTIFETIRIPKSIVDSVHRKMAAEAGLTLRQFRAALKRDARENWCHCEPQGDPIFHDDGCKPWKTCCNKHHFHCSKCSKLIQVG